MLYVFVVLSLIQVTWAYQRDTILVDNGGIWGDWGDLEMCPPGTSARAFSLLVEPNQGKGDDTALNAIQLYCAEPAKKDVKATITSSKGEWGIWTDVQWCPYGNFVSFSLKVEPAIDGDDTAANNIMLQCSDMKILRGHGGLWGNFGDWSDICYGGICGMKTRVEAPQNDGDDTALNDVEFLCCKHN